MIKVKINGKPIRVEQKKMIIEVADENGIDIPRFCYHKKLSVAANCRMCLIEVKNVPKPMPACATPITEGMEIFTKSKQTKDCQTSVMEFLLINHPLDCPICDQGGECDLQDTAMAYGSPKSRYQEEKRVVLNKNLGPLVSTDLNRCIQCSRCVRFLKEVGGMQELGLIGRGEHAEISAYVEKSVESEISGNVIDLCPVGALTSKPFRYTARSWEMIRKLTISPHDSLGSNLEVHTKDGDVMRVIPKEVESINECWISDRDRYSYVGINDNSRIKKPLLKQGSSFKEVTWEEAFQTIENKMHPKINNFKSDELVFFGSNQTSIEESFLVKRLANYFNSSQVLFDQKISSSLVNNPNLNNKIEEVENFDSVILLGSQLRNENPLILQRLRKMAHSGKAINVVNHIDFDLQLPVAFKTIKPIKEFSKFFKQLLNLVNTKNKNTGKSIDVLAEQITNKRTILLIGEDIYSNPEFLKLSSVLNEMINISKLSFGYLPTGANSVGLHQMFESFSNIPEIKKYEASITYNLEPKLDLYDQKTYKKIIENSKFNLLIAPYKSNEMKDYDLILPSCTHFENEGSFVNIEGRMQSFSQAVSPKFDSKPLWKILRVLGNYIECPNFNFESVSEIKQFAQKSLGLVKHKNITINDRDVEEMIWLFSLANVNRSDYLVRRSDPLQDIFKSRNEK